MAYLSIHAAYAVVRFHLSEAEQYDAQAWLLRADGTQAAVLSLAGPMEYDYSHLPPGIWFVKLEVRQQTFVKRLLFQ